MISDPAAAHPRVQTFAIPIPRAAAPSLLQCASLQYNELANAFRQTGKPDEILGMSHVACKLLADGDGKILGARSFSDNAAGLINVFPLAMVNGISANTLYRQSIMPPCPSRESDII